MNMLGSWTDMKRISGNTLEIQGKHIPSIFSSINVKLHAVPPDNSITQGQIWSGEV
jgi:hypothetical protein